MIEVIQGPCHQNQRALYEAKILDYCKDLMNEFAIGVENSLRGFQSDSHVLEDTVTLSVKLLYNLLEANRDIDILQNLALNIDFEYLMKVMTKEYLDIFERTKFKES